MKFSVWLNISMIKTDHSPGRWMNTWPFGLFRLIVLLQIHLPIKLQLFESSTKSFAKPQP